MKHGIRNYRFVFLLIVMGACVRPEGSPNSSSSKVQLWELNRDEIKIGEEYLALTGATVITGRAGEVIENATVIIKENMVVAVGDQEKITIPDQCTQVDLPGKFILPGLIDAHFHLGPVENLVPLFLSYGVTSLRDPGAWNETYLPWRKSGVAIPRLFLTGPHLDQYPPAHPANAYLVQDEKEAEVAVLDFIKQGASAIKVYYRLPLGVIERICQTAHKYEIPVTAHLEITNAADAIEAGLDGIEHITSFGTSLVHPKDGEKYRQLVLADNAARGRGRYDLWNQVDLEDTTYLKPLVHLVKERGTFVCPNLAVFEKQADRGDSIEVNGFENMVKFTGLLHQAGVRIVVGSHTFVPYAPLGLGYAHEMELLVKAGMSPEHVIESATWQNALFFKIEDRLGSIETGKIADLIVLDKNPLFDITAMRQIHKVMLNGLWIK